MPGERAILIQAGRVRLYAILDATPAAASVWEALPIEGRARLRGQAIFFDVGLRCNEEPETRREARCGDLGLWPEAKAIALFFGTPPSGAGAGPPDVSPVNVFARITGDASRLARVSEGDHVRLTALGD